jgi:hypothetical protein
MREITELIHSHSISCINDYKRLLMGIQYFREPNKFLYRGHSCCDYKLKSTLFRDNISEIEEILKIEKELFEEFKTLYQGKPEITIPHELKIKNEWHIYFQAQHLGLKTRLLDWTSNYLIALWFAVENESFWDIDGSVWLFACQRDQYVNAKEQLKEITENYHPLYFKGNKMINVPIYVHNSLDTSLAQNRIRNQNSHFWIQTDMDSTIPMTENPDYKEFLFEIVIKGEFKARIKEELANEEFLSKDLLYNNQTPVLKDIDTINKKYLKAPNN